MEREPCTSGNGRSTIDHDQLVAQCGWVKTVARNLVRDPYGADDVAQDTLLAALTAPPPDAPNVERMRAWLGRVAFNMSQLAARRNARRRTREERAAQAEALASAADDIARTSLSEHIADAVKQLDEPYRSAVQMRYFEGLSTADIAHRAGTSEGVVRKRLWRARSKLREVFAETGERESWLSALVALPAGARRSAGSLRDALGRSAARRGTPRLAASGAALGLAASLALVAILGRETREGAAIELGRTPLRSAAAAGTEGIEEAGTG